MMQQELVTKRALMTALCLWLNANNQASARIGDPRPFKRSLASDACYPVARKVRLESTTGEQIQMFELQAMSSNVNVALNKAASQSSTFKTKYASLALDGDSTTFSHTNDGNTTTPFWEVDLGGVFSLDSILIENRWCSDPSDTLGCLCRLSGATFSLLDEQDEVIASKSIGDTCGVVDLNFDFSSSCTENPVASPATPATQIDSCSPSARKVRLESTTGAQIQMFELQAMSSNVNVALSKNAIQSSTLSTKYASLALDGDSTTFSHTNDGNTTMPFWEVDLGGVFSLDSILIENRWCSSPSDTLGCLCRLSGATLSLLNEQDEVIASESIGDTCGVVDLNFDLLSSSCTESPVASPDTPETPATESPVASPATPATQIDSCSPSARKVRLESTTGAQIQMFELQAMSSNVNVALSKNAIQSSTLSTKYASLALDGDSTTFSHTNDGNTTTPFWEVDLGGEFSLDSILIENRWCSSPSDPSGCLCRLSGATLSLLDEQDEVIASESIGDTCGEVDLNFDFSSPSCTESPVASPEGPPSSTVGDGPAITFNDAIVVGDESFEITFNNPMENTEIYAAVISNSPCTEDNSSVEVDSDTPYAAFGQSSVTVLQSINELITTQDKNQGSVQLNFCLRADVRAPSFEHSLLASKVSIGITVNFQDESDISVGSGFTLEIETGGFSDTSIDYTSDRNVDVSAVLGECASPGNYGPYSIGSMLKFCVKSNDFDVVISGFSGVSFKDSDGNSILGIVDDSGEPSFLTTVAGLDSKSVDVATMMATTIFDQGYGGKTINVQGNVSVTYIDQTISSRRRQLQREESQPFALQLVVGEDSSEQGVLSSFPAISNGVIGAVVAVLAIGGLVLISSLV